MTKCVRALAAVAETWVKVPASMCQCLVFGTLALLETGNISSSDLAMGRPKPTKIHSCQTPKSIRQF